MKKTEKDWENSLSKEEFEVLRNKGTERPFSGIYNVHNEEGVYVCKGCGTELFDSSMKFDSGCGWPSFDKELAGGRINRIRDISHGMIRVEITCSSCDGHLGHVFNDGPTQTGERYCVNSISLDFKSE